MQAVDVVMYDLLGRKVLTTTPEYSGKTIDVSSLHLGHISCNLSMMRIEESKKIIIE
jgi:hypothetical protein